MTTGRINQITTMNWEYHEPSWSDREYKISIIWTQSRIRNNNSFSAIIYKKLQRLNKLVQCTLKFVCLSRNSYVLNKYQFMCTQMYWNRDKILFVLYTISMLASVRYLWNTLLMRKIMRKVDKESDYIQISLHSLD